MGVLVKDWHANMMRMATAQYARSPLNLCMVLCMVLDAAVLRMCASNEGTSERNGFQNNESSFY
jgi:hypothetical protein